MSTQSDESQVCPCLQARLVLGQIELVGIQGEAAQIELARDQAAFPLLYVLCQQLCAPEQCPVQIVALVSVCFGCNWEREEPL